MEDVIQTYMRPYDPKWPVVCFDEASKQLFGEVRPPERAEGDQDKAGDRGGAQADAEREAGGGQGRASVRVHACASDGKVLAGSGRAPRPPG